MNTSVPSNAAPQDDSPHGTVPFSVAASRHSVGRIRPSPRRGRVYTPRGLAVCCRPALAALHSGARAPMPVSWHISEGIVRLESSESVTFAEWKAAVDAALAHGDYGPGMGVL